MEEMSPIQAETSQQYLTRLGQLDFGPIPFFLGGWLDHKELVIPFLDRSYRLSGRGITDSSGLTAPFDLGVILCQYALRCPSRVLSPGEWVAYREFPESAPLLDYFAGEVEKPLANYFSGRGAALLATAELIGGRGLEIASGFQYDLLFSALPRVELRLLFNDEEKEFPATCSLLFRKTAATYLDPESLAMLGRRLAAELISRGGE